MPEVQPLVADISRVSAGSAATRIYTDARTHCSPLPRTGGEIPKLRLSNTGIPASLFRARKGFGSIRLITPEARRQPGYEMSKHAGHMKYRHGLIWQNHQVASTSPGGSPMKTGCTA